MSASMTREEMEKMLSSIPLDVLFEYTMLRFQDACFTNSQAKGFWDEPREIGTMIALMHSELSEALEAARTQNDLENSHLGPMSEKIPLYRGIEEEFADLLIRVADTCHGLGLNLGGAAVAKMEYNTKRPYLHGKTL